MLARDDSKSMRIEGREREDARVIVAGGVVW